MKIMPSVFPRRYLHLWFERMSTDRVRQALSATRIPTSSGAGTVTIAKVKGALRLQGVDEAAEFQGLHSGMTLADARALVPQLTIETADTGADHALLQRLAQVCRRYTPALALAAPDGLDLDVTGVAELFGDEAGLLYDLSSRLRGMGLSMSLGLADTPGLAWAVARFGQAGIAPVGEREEVLRPLPVAALKLNSDTVAGLARLGLKRIGQLLDMPRGPLARRFGPELIESLDQILGRRACPLSLELEPQPCRAERALADPISSETDILFFIRHLAGQVCLSLEDKGLGARRFVLELFRVDGAIKKLEVSASQSLRQADRITSLFTERLAGLNEGLEADFGFDLVRLCAAGVQPWVHQTRDLLGSGSKVAEFATLVDRIAARSGAQVLRMAPCDVHQPEPAGQVVPFAAKTPAWSDERPMGFDGVPLRPVRLFAPPQPIEVSAAEIPEGAPARFHWRRVQRRVVRAEGPERIEPRSGGEHRQPSLRDYYRLEDDEGRRYWVFRQGLYHRPLIEGCGAPSWFLHGLFG